MSRRAQANLSAAAPQPDLFGAEAAPVYRPDPAKVRARLHRLLAEAREAPTMPWEPAIQSLYRKIFPDMSRYLPEEEGARLRQEFEAEFVRLQGG